MTAPTTREVRRWAQGLGLPVADKGDLPLGVIQRWNREHPDRPFVVNPRHGRIGGWPVVPDLPEHGRRGGLAAAASRRGERPPS